ncbi:MAG: hypothetical protein IJR33_08905 [Clostridia bacterium]|nr:hypothetical protein [Clostridia bacterium]
MKTINTNKFNKRTIMGETWRRYKRAVSECGGWSNIHDTSLFSSILREVWAAIKGYKTREEVISEAEALWHNADDNVYHLLHVAIIKGAEKSLGKMDKKQIALNEDEAYNGIPTYYKNDVNPLYDAQIRYLLNLIDSPKAREDAVITLASYVASAVNRGKLADIRIADNAEQMLFYLMLQLAQSAIHKNRPIPQVMIDLDAPQTDNGATLAEVIGAEDERLEAVNNYKILEYIFNEVLTEDEARKLKDYIYRKHNAQAVADDYHITRQAVKKTIDRAYRKIRAYLASLRG